VPSQPVISVVIPFFNEEHSLSSLHQRLIAVLEGLHTTFELIFVDDGSTDSSSQVICRIAAEDPRVTLVQLRGNFGKSAALCAGFDNCKGEIIFTMDADLQDDPCEIPRFLAALDNGYDLVSGYKKERMDAWHKVYGSRVFNLAVRLVSGLSVHDVNCGFKCFRRKVIEEIRIYGELHRFIPILARWRRFRVGEIVIEHHPRSHGVSKFGASRIYRGLMDLLTVAFLVQYDSRPAHLFGFVGLCLGSLGLILCSYMSVLWFLGMRPIGHRPLLMLGALLVILGGQFLAIGLIAELQTHHVQQTHSPYAISRIVTGKNGKSSPGDEQE
jgi:glycosyltransferase involved in cell wall biosynthesis